jgi:transcriptional regulator
MYIPEPFREDRLDVLHVLMREHSFATIVSSGQTGLMATHLPLLLDAARGPKGTIVGHMARANPHWQDFRGGVEALMIFHGPHGYVSPSWYTTPYAVPTWNYVAVHAYGRPRLVEDEVALYRIVAETVHTYEAQFAYAWDLEERRDYAEKLLKNIIGFEVEITRLEGKLKLSQNRSPADQEGVIAGLSHQESLTDRALAAVMRERMEQSSG